MFKVLKLIQAGAGRRQEHHVPRFHQGSNLTHRLFHSLSLYRHLRTQLSELGAIATKAVQANTIAAEVALQRGKISGLAVAAQQQIERAVQLQAVQRRLGAADVGRLRVVNPAYAVVIQHQLETVRQTGKGGQRLQAAGPRQTRGIGQRQRRQGVAVVMLTGERHLFHIEDFLTFNAQPGFALLAVKVVVTDIDAKANAAFVRPAYRHGERIVRIHHAGLRILVNPQLRRAILLQPQRVAVHMVLSHVEDGCRHRLQAGGGFQLEAGELQHIQLSIGVQQHQRRQADIAAHADVNSSGFRHLAHQGSNSAFAVRTGNGDNRRLRFAAEQFDIANDLYASVGRCAERRMGQRNPRTGDNQVRRQQPGIIESADMAFDRFG